METQDKISEKKSISRSIYGLLILVLVVFFMILTFIQLQNKKIERLERIAYNYHLSISEKSQSILSSIAEMNLWYKNAYIIKEENTAHKVNNDLSSTPIHVGISSRDKTSSFEYEVNKYISEIRLLQDEFKDDAFTNISARLLKSYIQVIENLKNINPGDVRSFKNIDNLSSPLRTVAHQLSRLHKLEHQEKRRLIDKSIKNNQKQLIVLIVVLIIISAVGVIKLLQHLNFILLELITANKEKEFNQARFESMFESISDAVIVADTNRNISLLNSSVKKMFGYEKEELIGDNTSILYANTEDFNQTGKQNYNVDAKDDPVPYELEYRRKDGTVFWGETLGTKIVSDDGAVFGFVGIVRDITLRKKAESEINELNISLEERVKERTKKLKSTLFLLTDENEQRKKAENQYREAKEQAEKASAAKSDFLTRMSHELRTPMNAILGFGQLLELDSKKFNESQNSNIQEILEAGNHLLELINDVLDLTEIEAGKLEISMEKVELDDVISQCISLMEPIAKIRKIKQIDNISEKGYILHADFTRLKQVLLNLLSNAVKYNREEGSITLDGEIIDKQYLRISITDTGEGIKEEDLSKLFTSFERLNPKINVEGSGIGLNITKHIVELMGGKVGVMSTLGQGSTFWFELKLAKTL